MRVSLYRIKQKEKQNIFDDQRPAETNCIKYTFDLLASSVCFVNAYRTKVIFAFVKSYR